MYTKAEDFEVGDDLPGYGPIGSVTELDNGRLLFELEDGGRVRLPRRAKFIDAVVEQEVEDED